ncbi:MAG TPA: hypothetical protein VKR05_00185, partial [Candidatus Cybelea sp.]|nr:hypothetical protein [Candidatus Cybelea sp.]
QKFLSQPNDYKDISVHLVTATTTPPLPELGIFGEPAYVGSYDNFMWWLLLSRDSKTYTPLVVDAPGAGPIPGVEIPKIPPPPVFHRAIAGRELYYAPCEERERPMGRIGALPTSFTASYYLTCIVYNLGSLRHVAAVEINLEATASAYSRVLQPNLRYTSEGYNEVWLDPTDPAQEVPIWAKSGLYALQIEPYNQISIDKLTMDWITRDQRQSLPYYPTCPTSGVSWSQQNPMMYEMQATANGTCTVVFRQTYAAPWTLLASSNAKVLGHIHVDGFANGWIVQANGPVTFRVVNVMIYPYAIGMALTIAMLLLTIGLATASRVRAVAARRASRVPSPA